MLGGCDRESHRGLALEAAVNGGVSVPGLLQLDLSHQDHGTTVIRYRPAEPHKVRTDRQHLEINVGPSDKRRTVR